MALRVGATIAGFRVIRPLGEGGMGAVYLVQHPDLPRQDVLKVLHGDLARQPALRARFEHEARLAAGLNHPNVVQVFDRGVADDHLWIRMQYVDGTDASRALAAGPMDPHRVLHIVRSVGSALDYAHRVGLLHRDVKPANILLARGEHPDDPEHVLLTDFGIAKAADADVRLTGTGQALLTPAYSAPERFGSTPIDARVDVYSLGCVVFELLTGRLPYPYQSFLALVRAHDREPVPDIRELRPELPSGVTDVVRTALAKNRDERFPTCRALVDAFTAALRNGRPPVPPPPWWRAVPTTVHSPSAYPTGPYRITVQWGTEGSSPMTPTGQVDTSRLPTEERRRVETLVQDAWAARAGVQDAEPAAPGTLTVELAIAHPAGEERIRFVDGSPHHPRDWDRLAEAVAGPQAMAQLRARSRAETTRAGDRNFYPRALEPQPGPVPRPPGGRRALLAAVAVVLLVAGAVVGMVLWGGPDDVSSGEAAGGTGAAGGSDGGTGDGAGPVGGDVPTVYGVDGNTGDALGADFTEPGALDAMAGITPLAPLSPDFRDRLSDQVSGLETFNYGGEAYDATVVVALAVAMAGTTDAGVVRNYVNGVTFGGETCTEVAACLDVIAGGGNPDYDGVTGPLDLTAAGDPARAHFAVLQFGPDNAIANEETEYMLVGDAEDAADDEGPPPAPPGGTGGPLVLGTLLPLTGNLSFLGPPMRAGVDLAVQDLNAAGGVLGRPVEVLTGDSGDTSTDTATRTATSLLDSGVHAIIGAASSAVTLTVLDQITGAGVLMVSPANTSDRLTTTPDDGLYFRVAPPDRLQARALSELIVAHGHQSIGLLVIDDPYGASLGPALEENLAAAGVETTTVLYDGSASSFSDHVAHIATAAPDAVAVVGYLESAQIIAELNAQGLGPAR